MGSSCGHRGPYSLVYEPICADSHPIAERMSVSRRKARDLGQIEDPMSVLPFALRIRIRSYTLYEYKFDRHGYPIAKSVLRSTAVYDQ
jgi:hypothetical protein